MPNGNNKPGADAPGEKKLVLRPVAQEASQAPSVHVGTDAHRAAVSPQRRQAEAVVDPHLDETCSQPRTQSLISVLPPEAVVRLVLFAGRIARRQGKPLPPNIAARLGEALARGDLTAPALRDWAIRIGVLADGAGVTPAGSRATDPGLAGSDRVTEHDRGTMRAVMLARHLRERLGMSRPALRAKVERKSFLGARPITLSASDEARGTVSDDPGRRS